MLYLLRSTYREIGVVFLGILLFFVACSRESQDVQAIETTVMAADVNDTTSKTLSLTSGTDQTLVSVNFPQRADNYFRVTDVAINGESLEKGTDFNNINLPIKQGDEIVITVSYAPTTLPDPGEDLVRKQVLKVILNGPKVVNVSFRLYGVSHGICETCKATIPATAQERHYTVKNLGIHLSDNDASPSEADLDGEAQGDFVLYVDEAGGKVFLKGENIPQFAIKTPAGTATASGKEGELFEGTYEKKDDGEHMTLYEVHLYAPSASSPDLYTDLTTESIDVSDEEGSSYLDGEHDDAYKTYYDFTNVDGTYSDTGLPQSEKELTLVGGVILPKANVLQVLEGAVLGFSFKLSLND